MQGPTPLFDHVTIGAADRERSRAFYATVLPVLGVARTDDPRYVEWGDFSIAQAGADRPVTRRLHVGFAAADAAQVDAFWRAGVDAGLPSDGAPGPRPEYGPDYYGGFLLDPDGNSIEACVHDNVAPPGCIDHLWFRVADRAAARAFYTAIAPFAGITQVADDEQLTRFRRGPQRGSFSLVDGDDATTPFHLAFGAPDRETVRGFHAAATHAGAPDNGAPGERPEYHPGYFGAFVLDPDGHNVEVVHHDR